jgi:choline dehydrogenase-like flavoprotein
MPPPSRKEWAAFGFDASVLESHYDRVKQEINISELSPQSVNKTVESLFSKGISGYNAECNGLGPLSPAKRLSGNFKNCLGCGLCNIGCKRMRKMSVLETYLPWAMARGVMVRSGADALECETEPAAGSKKRVTGLVVRGRDGRVRRIRIRKALIVAGGAIQSSRFLMDSKVGGAGVGKGLSCNYAFPTLVEFDELIDAFDGVQITMFAAPESYEAIFETTYNPPGGYSVSIPRYFGGHAQMMGAYRRATNFGTLVGSDPSGEVRQRPDLMFGHAIEWNQNPAEISRISRALATLARIARAAGARRILLPTHPALSIELGSGIEQTLKMMEQLLNDKRYFNFATAHPQGGNMMAGESHGERVVDLDFRVRDCDNLFVCDASIFPRGIRVNPQWTIMALASLAAESIDALT